jgi:2-succinyl-5-enolpyruvyl-6-hydroxy-3-cyclohexene-1-carboxylate synthase
MIIINNSGGGIFRILPGEKEKEYYKTYFETTHELNAAHLAKMYNWGYNSANDKESSLKEIDNLFSKVHNQPQILEIFTPRTLNDEVLLQYFKFIG